MASQYVTATPARELTVQTVRTISSSTLMMMMMTKAMTDSVLWPLGPGPGAGQALTPAGAQRLPFCSKPPPWSPARVKGRPCQAGSHPSFHSLCAGATWLQGFPLCHHHGPPRLGQELRLAPCLALSPGSGGGFGTRRQEAALKCQEAAWLPGPELRGGSLQPGPAV